MKKNNHVEVTILEPERWYLRYTQKQKHYIQLHSAFWGDSEFLALNNDEKIMFLWILSQSLRVNKASFSICLEFAYGLLNLSLGTSKGSLSTPLAVSKGILNSLKKNNFIDLDRSLRTQLIEHNKRKENIIEANKNSTSKEVVHILSNDNVKNTEHNTPHARDAILELWNSNCAKFGMPKVNVLSSSRKQKLDKALKVFSQLDQWRIIFTVASDKGFTNKDGKEFIPNWDYIFRNENYIKFYEEGTAEEKPKSEEQLVKSIESYLLGS